MHTRLVAREMRKHMGTDWCLAESGATGPTFIPPDCNEGFTALAICGPEDVEDVVIVASDHADREDNMWHFTHTALDFMEQCLRRHQASDHPLI